MSHAEPGPDSLFCNTLLEPDQTADLSFTDSYTFTNRYSSTSGPISKKPLHDNDQIGNTPVLIYARNARITPVIWHNLMPSHSSSGWLLRTWTINSKWTQLGTSLSTFYPFRTSYLMIYSSSQTSWPRLPAHIPYTLAATSGAYSLSYPWTGLTGSLGVTSGTLSVGLP